MDGLLSSEKFAWNSCAAKSPSELVLLLWLCLNVIPSVYHLSYFHSLTVHSLFSCIHRLLTSVVNSCACAAVLVPPQHAPVVRELTFVCSLVRGSPEATVNYRVQGKQVASGHKLCGSVHVPYMGHRSARDIYVCYTGGAYVHVQCTLMYQIRGIRPVREWK